jgi:hypothetical protein
MPNHKFSTNASLEEILSGAQFIMMSKRNFSKVMWMVLFRTKLRSELLRNLITIVYKTSSCLK